MRLLGKNKLRGLNANDAQVSKWISGWTSEVQKAYWNEAADLMRQFPKAKYSPPNQFLFKINATGLALEVSICFIHRIVLIVGFSKIDMD